jgi:hypothetical protein
LARRGERDPDQLRDRLITEAGAANGNDSGRGEVEGAATCITFSFGTNRKQIYPSLDRNRSPFESTAFEKLAAKTSQLAGQGGAFLAATA